MKSIIFRSALIFLFAFISCQNNRPVLPATEMNSALKEWEKLRFGAFIHFNDNSCIEKEISRNTDPSVFNPEYLDFDDMMAAFQQAGIKYAVLTTRHTSGFCLWNSDYTEFDVSKSPFQKDVVKMFVEACHKYNIKPCFYYCLWGGKWKPWEWNPMIKKELEEHSPKQIIKGQLTELVENYGEIYEFWLDMMNWADTTIQEQELYNLLKEKNPQVFVHFNQHVQDGSEIHYFPTDFLNGEERIPPIEGHNPYREINGQTYYLPFEYEITSQRFDPLTLGNGLMTGSVWFTYPQSTFYPVDSLYKYIQQSFERGGSNILLSTAPDKTGTYRENDKDSIIKLGKRIR